MRIIVMAQSRTQRAAMIPNTAKFFLNFDLCMGEWGMCLSYHDGEEEGEKVEDGISEHELCVF